MARYDMECVVEYVIVWFGIDMHKDFNFFGFMVALLGERYKTSEKMLQSFGRNLQFQVN